MMGVLCEEMTAAINQGLVKLNAEGKLRLGDGSFIPNFPNAATIRDRVEKFYTKRQSQFYLGDDDDDHTPTVSAAKT